MRCPQCGFEGREEEFSGGCPACGHLQPTLADPAAPRSRRPARSGRWPAPAPARHSRVPAVRFSRNFYAWAGAALAALAVILLVLLLIAPWARR